MDGFERIGVVGCGTMGAGICEVVAVHGFDVVFVESDDDAVRRAHDRIAASFDRAVERGRYDDAVRRAAVGRIRGTSEVAALADRDLVVEAVPEILAVKQRVLAEIDGHVGPDTIIATNTSSLPVIDLAVHTGRPNRVIGMHFFNPAPAMDLIELVRTVVTDEDVLERARAFVTAIGKTVVTVGDRAGFIANQLLFPFLNQAVGMVDSGYATKEDVDAAMRYGAGHPMGPIAVADLVGLDTMLETMDAIHREFQDTRFAPSPIIAQLVAADFRGRKSGRGFYTYAEPGSGRVVGGGAVAPAPDPSRVDTWTTVGVLGTGTMASGVTEVCAKAGYRVVVRGRGKGKAERVVAAASKSMQRLIDRGRITEQDMLEALGRIEATDDIEALAGCDLVLEAVTEDLGVKQELFATLDGLVRPDAVLGTLTSSLPVIECAMATAHPHRVVGLHFFNPAAIMRLVEVVPTVRTDPEVTAAARAFVDRVGKVGVLSRDRAGLIVNGLLFPYLNDAVKMLDSHYATVEEIDTSMKLGCGHPMGPFELMDVVGLDVTLSIVDQLHAAYREESFAASPLLRYMVDAGFLGRKAGRGFYVHP